MHLQTGHGSSSPTFLPGPIAFLLLGLIVCTAVSPTPLAPLPTLTPTITPTSTPLPLWKEAEIAIAQALADTPKALCEWVPFARRGREVYTDAICRTEISGYYGVVILFLGPDGEIQNSGSVGPKEFGGIVEILDAGVEKEMSQKGLVGEQKEAAEKHIQQRWQDGSPPYIATIGQGWPDVIAKRPTPEPPRPTLRYWMIYESAISSAYDLPRALCEWIIVARRYQQVILDVYCENDSQSVTGPVLIYLTPPIGIRGAWAPPAGDECAAYKEFRPKLYDLYLDRRMDLEALAAAKKHIQQRRREGLRAPPLIVLSGVELP